MKNVRNITFELCAWGFGNVETFGASFGHVWRTSMDVKVRCEVVASWSHSDIVSLCHCVIVT